MKATRNLYMYSLWLLLLAFSGCDKPVTKPTEIRLGDFLQNSAEVTIQVHNENGFSDSIVVKYGEITTYKTLQPGRYTFEVYTQQKKILDKVYGLGDAGKYTLAISGLLTPETEVNKQTTIAKLENITEGAAAHPANGYYPEISLFNDYFVKEKGKGKVRVVNLLPGAVSFDVSFYNNGKEAISFSGLKYPKAGETKPLKPGSYTIKLKYKGNALAAGFTNEAIEEDALTTFYIIPNPDSDTPLLVKAVAGK